MSALITIDPAAVPAAGPYRIRHALSDETLLSLDALAQLAAALPGDQVEYNGGDIAPGAAVEDIPRIDMGAAEIVRRIETARAWMVLKRVETVPAYRALVQRALDDAARQRGHRSARDAGFTNMEGFIFVSSANATTPFHFDAEDNFFVQIRGDKQFRVFDNRDGALVPDAELELSPAKHRNLPYDPAFEARAQVFDMREGDGLFVPYLWPHWVRTGDDYSISMAITWKSPEIARRNRLLSANAMLRAAGWPQPRPGQRPAFDAAKSAAYALARACVEPLRRSETMRRRLRALVFGRKANYFYNDEPA